MVRALDSGAAAPVLAALERQTRPPHEVVALAPGGDPLKALPPHAEWAWLLDGSVVPEPAALERLLEVAPGPGALPAPVLLASKVVTPGGAFDRRSLVVAQVMDRDVAVEAFERHVVSLRLVRGGSLLVRAGALGRPGPDPFADDLRWTARLLREGPGLLVPGSVAVRRAMDPRAARSSARRELVDRARLLAGDAIDPRDKPWFILRLVEDAPALVRGRAAA